MGPIVLFVGLFIGFLGSAPSLFAQALGSAEASHLNQWKAPLLRPKVTPGPNLEQRSGFLKSEWTAVRRKLKPDEIKEAELIGKKFWTSPLLRAFPGLVHGSPQNEVDLDDDWFSLYTEQDEGDFFVDERERHLPDVRLIFLSESGYKRIQESEEISATPSVESLASIPVADFCERNPGKTIPVKFSSQFSPWDMGAQLASHSRLDLSLFELILKPDALDSDAGNDKDDEDDDLDDVGGENESQMTWFDVLDHFEPKIKMGSVTIADVANYIRRNQTMDQNLKRIILAAAVSSADYKKSCADLSGQWHEFTWNAEHWLEVFSCRSSDQKIIGPLFVVEDGDFDEGEISFSENTRHFHLVASVRRDDLAFSVRSFYDDQAFGVVIWFDVNGAVRAYLDDVSTQSGLTVLNSKNEVSWIKSGAAWPGYRNISWYPNGQVRSFIFSSTGDPSETIAGFYQNGKPKYFAPVRDAKWHGTFMWWHAEGALAGAIDYAIGEKNGRGTLFYQNGSVGFQSTYVQNQPHGRLVWRDPETHPLFEMGYTAGRPEGLLEIKEGGQVIATANFVDGAVDGVIVLRNKSGITIAEIPYKRGMLNGTVILRDHSNVVRAKSNWRDGQAHGPTESYYASGKRAATCSFDQGRLVDWSSQKITGALRYKGRVTQYTEGRAQIDYYVKGSDAFLSCSSTEWYLSDCTAKVGSQKISVPSEKILLTHAHDSTELKYKPEKCGGTLRMVDVSPLLDQGVGSVEVAHHVKELCRGKDLATGLQCDVKFSGKAWTVSSCVLLDEEFLPD